MNVSSRNSELKFNEIDLKIEKLKSQKREFINRMKNLLETIMPVPPKQEAPPVKTMVLDKNPGEIIKSKAYLDQEERLRISRERGRKNAVEHSRKLLTERKKKSENHFEELFNVCKSRLNRAPVNIEEVDMKINAAKEKKKSERSIPFFNFDMLEKKREAKEEKNEIPDSTWSDGDDFLETNDNGFSEIMLKREEVIRSAEHRPISRSISMYSISIEEKNEKDFFAECIRGVLLRRRKDFSSDEES